MQTTTTEPEQLMTYATAPAPCRAAGDLEQRLAFCLTAAVLAGRTHRVQADRALSRWLMRPVEATGLLKQFAHVSAAQRGVVLTKWEPS